MWKNNNIFDYYDCQEVTENIKCIYILNVDNGIAWDTCGNKYPIYNKWMWFSNKVPSYINSLTDNNICILHSEYKNSKDAINQMKYQLKNRNIYCVIGITINILCNILNDKNSFNSIIEIDNILPIITVPKIKKYVGYNLENIPELETNIELPKNKNLFIMMGQEGSGKTNYAKKLQNQGYIIISEPLISSIKRRNKKSIEILKKILLKNEKGVIIDSCNPTHKDRLIFTEIANSLNIDSTILWCSKPGYTYNNIRYQKIPDIILNVYTKNIEPPNFFNINYIHIV